MKIDNSWIKCTRVLNGIKELTSAEVIITSALIQEADGIGGTVKIFTKALGAIVNLNKVTVRLCLQHLDKLNIIKRTYTLEDKQNHRPPQYYIQPSIEWSCKTELTYRQDITAFDKAYDFVLHTKKLSTSERRLLIRLMGSFESNHSVRKKQGTLAKELKISKSTVQRALLKLKTLNIITSEHSTTDKIQHRPAKFFLRPLKYWKISTSVDVNTTESGAFRPVIPQPGGRITNDYSKEKSIYILSSFQSVTKDKSLVTDLKRKLNATKGGVGRPHIKLSKKLFNKNKMALLDDPKYVAALKKLNQEHLFAINKLKKSLLVKSKKKPSKNNLRAKLCKAHVKDKTKFDNRYVVKPRQTTLSVLNKWKQMQKEFPHLYTKHKKLKTNKTYQIIVKALNDFFAGKLYSNGTAVLPEGMELFSKKYTLRDMFIFLDRLHVQMSDPYIGKNPFVNRKANLKEFLLGNTRANVAIPSKLLSTCLEEPIIHKIEYPEIIKHLQTFYRKSINPDHIFTTFELQALNKWCLWAVPFSRKIGKTFKSVTIRMLYDVSCRIIRKMTASDKIPITLFGKEFLEESVKREIRKLGYVF